METEAHLENSRRHSWKVRPIISLTEQSRIHVPFHISRKCWLDVNRLLYTTASFGALPTHPTSLRSLCSSSDLQPCHRRDGSMRRKRLFCSPFPPPPRSLSHRFRNFSPTALLKALLPLRNCSAKTLMSLGDFVSRIFPLKQQRSSGLLGVASWVGSLRGGQATAIGHSHGMGWDGMGGRRTNRFRFSHINAYLLPPISLFLFHVSLAHTHTNE